MAVIDPCSGGEEHYKCNISIQVQFLLYKGTYIAVPVK